jgi:hypothetical protein
MLPFHFCSTWPGLEQKVDDDLRAQITQSCCSFQVTYEITSPLVAVHTFLLNSGQVPLRLGTWLSSRALA